MYSPEDLEFREQQRLSKALQGKLGSQGPRKSWAPVVTGKPQQTSAPVNSIGSISLSDSQPRDGVDTTSIYPGAIAHDEKSKEAQRLKKMGLASGDQEDEELNNIPAYQSLNSSTSSMTKSTSNSNLAKETSSSNLLQYSSQAPVRVANSTSSENLVDSASIMNNVDSHTSEEKMKQEAKRLERWGLKINTPNVTSPTTTSPPVSSTTPSANPTTPSSESVPHSPFTTGAAVSVNQSNSTLSIASTQQFLDRIVLSAKSVKQIIQKKTSNRDIVIAILMDLVKESASFSVNLPSTSSMSFDISQNAGKLAGAVNELVKDTTHDEVAQKSLFDEIQVILGLLYLAVVAN